MSRPKTVDEKLDGIMSALVSLHSLMRTHILIHKRDNNPKKPIIVTNLSTHKTHYAVDNKTFCGKRTDNEHYFVTSLDPNRTRAECDICDKKERYIRATPDHWLWIASVDER